MLFFRFLAPKKTQACVELQEPPIRFNRRETPPHCSTPRVQHNELPVSGAGFPLRRSKLRSWHAAFASMPASRIPCAGPSAKPPRKSVGAKDGKMDCGLKKSRPHAGDTEAAGDVCYGRPARPQVVSCQAGGRLWGLQLRLQRPLAGDSLRHRSLRRLGWSQSPHLALFPPRHPSRALAGMPVSWKILRRTGRGSAGSHLGFPGTISRRIQMNRTAPTVATMRLPINP